ncbi:unnamed protein product [Schistosoma curassoni]|uniref:Endo/exonuclease/phosphatase domain-containing protein n=1 Tax=Schistosoma curassoni TaxID=6186 RepID=A0A183KUL3_9TREM|nr:unnamed protein product [Schistosoma curassoni]
MGDFNAKVGMDNTGYEDIMGRHGLEERNKNGGRFANLCAFNKPVIGGTIFSHKRIHEITWASPDHTTQNQINHICIDKKLKRTMEDVRSKRGANIASGHHLLVAKMKLKLKKYWTTGQTISQLSGNHLKPERPVKSKEGKVITNIEEQRNGWVEHFKELLNRPAPLNFGV